jgi:protein-S-isoprenylcysteine O-methyltransferase Ste14
MERKKMRIYGIGPALILSGVPFIVLTCILSNILMNGFRYPFINISILKIFGILDIVIGTIFWVIAVCTFHPAFEAGKLVTKGVYSYCRNPIYSSWILFIVPGISLFLNNYMVLSIAIGMYCFFKLFISRETKMLQQIFGEEYLNYKQRTNEIVPFPKKMI